MRFALGILTLAVLAATAPAAVQTYRVTGAFDYADGDFEGLMGTSFAFDLAYDTDAPNLGDETGAAYELSSVGLTTNLGTAGGVGVATVDLDPEWGSMTFGAVDGAGENYALAYGINLGDLAPQSGALPTDLAAVAASGTTTFFMVGTGSVGTIPGMSAIGGIGVASASQVNVQAVPEPASMAALAVGAVGLMRRRRAAR